MVFVIGVLLSSFFCFTIKLLISSFRLYHRVVFLNIRFSLGPLVCPRTRHLTSFVDVFQNGFVLIPCRFFLFPSTSVVFSKWFICLTRYVNLSLFCHYSLSSHCFVSSSFSHHSLFILFRTTWFIVWFSTLGCSFSVSFRMMVHAVLVIIVVFPFCLLSLLWLIGWLYEFIRCCFSTLIVSWSSLLTA